MALKNGDVIPISQIHKRELRKRNILILVDGCINDDTYISILVGDLILVEEVVRSFVAWSKYLIIIGDYEVKRTLV